jgi:uncharacterized membrane protein
LKVQGLFKQFAELPALGIESGAVVIIAYGAIQAFWGASVAIVRWQGRTGRRKEVWLSFGMWLLLGLEFELAADIIRTVISPTWIQMGQLAMIAAIRTFLSYFLEKDLEKYEPPGSSERAATLSWTQKRPGQRLRQPTE